MTARASGGAYCRPSPRVSSSRLAACRFVIALFFLTAWSLSFVRNAQAQSFAITQITRDGSGTLHLRFNSDTNSYYTLLQGTSISAVSTASGMALGNSGLQEFTPIAGSAPSTFYRIRRVPLLQPLDTDGDGLDDVTELHLPDALNPLNANDPFTTISQSSPSPGETDVAVTRETVLDFSMPLSQNTTIATDRFYATYGNRRLLARVELSTDKRKATLFYQEPLPGNARISVVFDGTGLSDYLGRPIDPNSDGVAGGSASIQFDTLGLAPVPNTAVIGRVFASEPVQGPGTTNFVNRPLAGVTITVDGREQELRTTTDAEGRFKLEPVPAGKFFVHVDGRTAQGSQWPTGDYYPAIGKAWEAVPGRVDNLAGGNGEIFLPLIIEGTLQSVSPTTNTIVTFPSSVVSNNPAMAGVSIAVPANSLFSDNGLRGGFVGIAPVPSDRLPEPLPRGLNLPIVITVQTDGPSNFDRPVPVRFPNLPDPRTGLRLPAGTKSALWSFNHDLGRWEIVGPMTVTEDGLFVDTDAGIGIRQPGWHGSQPGTQGAGGPLGSSGGGNGNDNDGDGIPNGDDDDIDGDGVPNGSDGDTDGDGVPNGNDPDVDDDGIPNGDDDDTDGDGIGNGSDGDVDGDGAANGEDGDIDGDGFPNGADDDADGDGLENEADDDADGDGLPNYDDPDADGDGIPNEQDDDSGLECTPPDCPNPCENPQVQITASPLAGSFLAPNEHFMFQASGTPSGGSFSWSGGTAAGPSNGSDYTAFFTAPGNYSVTVTYTCPEGGGSVSASTTVIVGTSSGINWCAQFPGSESTTALNQPFRGNVERFIGAMNTAGANVNISTTYRPVERAYLMHYAVKIANGSITPANAGAPPAGVLICWRHFNPNGTENIAAARAAAQAMIGLAPGYNIAFPAAYPTFHSQRAAIDMTITWATTNLTIINGTGGTVVITSQPNDILPNPMHGGRRINDVNYVGNTALHAVGASYNVIKLAPDPPHWSTTGN